MRILHDRLNYRAIVRALKKEGFNELAAEVSNQGKAADAPGILAKAKKQAEDEASEKAAWWRPDSTDFADDEGSPTKYIERRTKEIAAELSGEGGKTLPEKPKADQTPYTGDTQPRGHPGAKKADDGFWYVERNGKHHQIVNDDATAGNGEIIDITGTQQSQKDQLAKVPVGRARVRVEGKLYLKRAGGFVPVGGATGAAPMDRAR